MPNKRVVILGTGGTIAGTANSASDITNYTAAQLLYQCLGTRHPCVGGYGSHRG